MARTRKGQYSLVEQVILFGLGISITLGFLFAFDGLEENIQDRTGGEQASLVAEYVASSAVELVESGAEGRISFNMPSMIASKRYAVRLEDGSVTVVSSGNSDETVVYGLGSKVDFQGVEDSRGGVMSLTFEDGTVNAGRE
ncbi:MAG: hypothetical protein SVQ76_02210 [Candidatus Nanohaloarchaea archaeon]|nr:hypothetical protein [Candidatus Nanohaloarchaea archaeon]